MAKKLKKNKRASLVGIGLMVVAIAGFFLTYGSLIKSEVVYRLERPALARTSALGGFAQLLAPATEISGVPDPEFSIIIPKIAARARVVPNVDTADYNAYMAALKEGVAHAKGTGYPGGVGQNIYLFAHSTDSPLNIARYNAVFFLLRELEAGDEVEVYFQGIKHRYSVYDKKIIPPADTAYLTPTSPDGEERLILQTCWPPGTSLERLLIFAKPISLTAARAPDKPEASATPAVY